jgi:hypothetical protein
MTMTKIVIFFLNLLITGAVILFSLSLSFILSYLFFKFAIGSADVTSAMVTLFVSGVIISLSISLKGLFDKELKALPHYLMIAKIIGLLTTVMIIIRYMNLG